MGATSDIDFLTFRRKTIDLSEPVHPTPPSLHHPQMWEDFRQCLYEACIRMERLERRKRRMQRLRQLHRISRNAEAAMG